MKNGCCKECMKAFSKTGKVIYRANIYRVVCARYRDCREERHYQQMDASIVGVRVAILLILEEIRDKK